MDLSWFLIDHLSSGSGCLVPERHLLETSASKERVEDLVSKVVMFGERGGQAQTTIVTSPQRKSPAPTASGEDEAFAKLALSQLEFSLDG
jgi:hypothetical protein